MDFKVPTGTTGDCFERFLVRVEEMRQSVSIIRQCLKNIPDGPSISNDPRVVPPKREIMKESMESLINHFKLFTEGFMFLLEKLIRLLKLLKENLVFFLFQMELTNHIDVD